MIRKKGASELCFPFGAGAPLHRTGLLEKEGTAARARRGAGAGAGTDESLLPPEKMSFFRERKGRAKS